MAILAREVLTEAERRFKRADVLAAEMEPHVQRLYTNSAIYSYTNERAIPPGDVLLAAALAAGISLDGKLGIGQQPTEMELQVDELRTEVAQLRDQMANLHHRLAGGEPPDGPARQTAEDAAAAKARRSAERREWARRSEAAPSAPAQGISGRRSGRGRGAG